MKIILPKYLKSALRSFVETKIDIPSLCWVYLNLISVFCTEISVNVRARRKPRLTTALCVGPWFNVPCVGRTGLTMCRMLPEALP